MRHVYECPMRWADLDQLGHVNNVVYADYLQEARIDLMRAMLPSWRGELTEGVVVVRHEVTYLAPLTFGFEPVLVECWVTRVRAATFTIAYEVFQPASDGGRTVYLRATSVLAPYDFTHERPRRISPEEREVLAGYTEPGQHSSAAPLVPVQAERAVTWPLQVRFSDVDVYRHVNNVKYFEYFQESRIRTFAEVMGGDRSALHVVVAQTDVDYLAPIVLRSRPYEALSEIVRLGGRSLTVAGEVRDGDQVLARSRVTLVFWDGATQRSTDADPAVRARLAQVARDVGAAGGSGGPATS